MNLSYHLTGTFIEACNCTVICPCWLDDEPTEDFCAGLYAWTFAPGSTIEQYDVSGRTVVSVTVHGDSRRGGTSESAIFVQRSADEKADRAVALLLQAFGGLAGGPLADLGPVTGDVIMDGLADIRVEQNGGGYEVEVHAKGARLVHVTGTPKRFDSNTEPVRLTDSALHHEMGIGTSPVTVHVSDEFAVDIAALPGPSIDVLTRSGMTGTFRYVGDGRDEDPDPRRGG